MRWRPAKAFLLDERNALVQEIALDPQCGVTLPEAMTSAFMTFVATVAFFAIAGPLALAFGADSRPNDCQQRRWL